MNLTLLLLLQKKKKKNEANYCTEHDALPRLSVLKSYTMLQAKILLLMSASLA
jgi:hypothetical protein